MLENYRLEFAKTFRRPRTYLGFVAVGAISILFTIAFHYMDVSTFLEHNGVSAFFTMVGSAVNALFVAMMVLSGPTMELFIPAIVVLVAGDLLAGEAAEGTLKMVLVRPVKRARIYFAKFALAGTYTVLIMVALGLASFLLGALVFGIGDLMVPGPFLLINQWINLFPVEEGIMRLIGAYALAAWAMLTMAALAFAISGGIDNANGAIITPLVLMLLLKIMALFPTFDGIRPYLFTSHFDLWKSLFMAEVPWKEVWRSAEYLGLHTFLFLAAGLAVFNRRDILS
ncbi:MAG: ABC transporter permease [Syntrophothermus sp.]